MERKKKLLERNLTFFNIFILITIFSSIFAIVISFSAQDVYAALPTAPPDVTATADIDTVIVDWDAVVAVPEVDRYWIERGFSFNDTWFYKEGHPSGGANNCIGGLVSDGIRIRSFGSGAFSLCHVFMNFPTPTINNTALFEIDWSASIASGVSAVARTCAKTSTEPLDRTTASLFAGTAGCAFTPDRLGGVETATMTVGSHVPEIDIVNPMWASETELDNVWLAVELQDLSILSNNPEIIIYGVNMTDQLGNNLFYWNFTGSSFTMEFTGGTDDYGYFVAGNTTENNNLFEVIGSTDGLTDVWQDEFSTYPDNATGNLVWVPTIEGLGSSDDIASVNTTADNLVFRANGQSSTRILVDLSAILGQNVTSTTGIGDYSLTWQHQAIEDEANLNGGLLYVGLFENDPSGGIDGINTGATTGWSWKDPPATSNAIVIATDDSDSASAMNIPLGSDSTCGLGSDVFTDLTPNDGFADSPITTYHEFNKTGTTFTYRVGTSQDYSGLGCSASGITTDTIRNLKYLVVHVANAGGGTDPDHKNYLDDFVLQVEGQEPVTIFVDTTQDRATNYVYGVFGENTDGNGTAGLSNNVLTNDVPDQVENLMAEPQVSQIDLQWNALAFNSGEGNPSTGLNLTRYDVWRNNVTTGGGFFLLASNLANSPPQNYYNDSQVVLGNTYEYKVSGCNAIDCGINSTSASASITVTSVDLTGLKAYYKFDESSGDLINLAGAVGSTVSLGTPANGQLESGIIQGDSGIIGNAYLFPGASNGQIQLGTSTSQFNFMHNSTTMTWSVNYWQNTTNTDALQAIIHNNVATTANVGMNIAHDGQVVVESSFASIGRGVLFTAVAQGTSTPGTIPSDGQWHMATVTYDHSLPTNNLKFYIDSVFAGAATKSGDTPSANNAAVAMEIAGYGNEFPYNGNLDEMSIWNKILTPSEISLLYNGGAGGELGSLTQGTLQITKITTAANDLFNFTVSGPTSFVTSINTIGGTGTTGQSTVTPGTYSVQELIPTGWGLTTASCTDGFSTFNVDIVTGIIINANDNIQCTFTNTPTCNGIAATMVGTENNDVIVGTGGNDVIIGRGGNDTISGQGGDDTICGGDGNDTISGNIGSDTIFGDAGIDQLFGNDGSDVIRGGLGIDYIEGGAADDTIFGEDGNDTIYGQAGPDTIDGGNGHDLISGDAGNDIITGGDGDDTILGAADADTLSGNSGDDKLLGEGGNDSLDGGNNEPAGVDICIGGGQGGDTSVNCEVTI